MLARRSERQPHDEARAVGRDVLERDRAAVRLGDGAHDRQAEAERAAAVAGAAHEALEQGGRQLGRHAGAVVLAR